MQRPPAEPPLLISRKEAARLLGLTVRSLYTLERQGAFTPVRVGRSLRYRRADLDAAIERLANPITPEESQ
jgi:excisionase family DNA binding protein